MRGRIRYIIEPLIHVLFWIGVYYTLKALTTINFGMIIRDADKGTQRIGVSLLFPYSRVVFGFLILLFYSNTLWLFRRVIRFNSIFARVSAIAGWFILVFAINYGVIHLLIGPSGVVHIAPPPGSGPSLLPPPVGDSWLHMQTVILLIYLSVFAVALASFFVKEWIRNDLARAEQLSMEVKFLRSQINPHFLFNTLNNLFSMAQKKGNDDLADGVSKLSGIMRYMLYESTTEKVSLQKEIDYLKNCIALNKLRYADSEVTVSFSHPPLFGSDVQVAPMLFIPFLENAFKHGVLIGHRSYITVVLTVDAQRLIFTCSNTDHSAIRKLEEGQSGIGLANVKRHLELVYPGHYSLRTGSEDGHYNVHLQLDLA